MTSTSRSTGVSFAASNDPFPNHQSPPDRATFEDAHNSSTSTPSATHDPILHGHLLQSKYRGAGLRNLGSKWRHVVLNIRTGELCIYQVEQDEGSGAGSGAGLTLGKKVGGSKRDSTASSEVAISAKNRTKSELYFLPKDQNKGGRIGNSKAAALLVGSILPQEADLILCLPAGTWAIKDLMGNDTAFVVKYDLRSAELTGSNEMQGDQDDELTLESNATAGTKSHTAKIRSLNLGKMGKKAPTSRPSEQAADDPFFVDDNENASVGMSTVQSEFTSATATVGGINKLAKSKGKITLRCPGGGNEKAMWGTAASKCSGIDAIAPELLEAIAPQSKSQLSAIGETVSTQSKTAFKILSKSKPVKQIGKTVPKSIQPKNVTWRYRKDFTAAGALNMSVLIKGPLPDSALSEMHRSIVQNDDEDMSIVDNTKFDEDEHGRVKEYKVQPQWAYPNVWMTPPELKREMLRTSDHFHDLRDDGQSAANNLSRRVGSLHVEVLSCHGLARQETVADAINLSDGSGGAVVYLVAGAKAFCTDTIPGIRDHFWLRKTRRAAIFPLYHPYDHLYAGVFDADTNDFSGRVCIDVAKLRPDSTYNITLPLRQSAQMYARRGRGTIQLRFKLEWDDDKAAVLSYLPPSLRTQPVSIPCGDKVAFRNVAQTVYGEDLHGKWSRTIMKATTKELKLYKKHTKALKKQMLSDLSGWVNPIFSLYVFIAWMHCVYQASMALILPYFFGFIIMWLVRNYATFVLGSYKNMGYAQPTIPELIVSLFGLKAIRPLDVKKRSAHDPPPMPQRPLAEKMYRATGFKECDAYLDEEGYHLEFPFSDGDRHRKVLMSEAYAKDLAPKPAGVKTLPGPLRDSNLSSVEITENDLFTFDEDDENNTLGMEMSETSSRFLASQADNVSGRTRVTEHIAPDQDMDVPYKGTTIFEDLEEFLGIAHHATFGLVNDRVVKARKLVLKSYQAAASRRQLVDSSTHSEELGFDFAEDNEPIIATMEKALGIGVQRNPVLQMQQKFCGPVVQIQRVGLIAYRSVFNLFIWSDSYASFWLLCVLISLVVITALFPWRFMFFFAGIGFVGPQNWLLRLHRERNPPGEDGATNTEPLAVLKKPSIHEAINKENLVSKALKKIPHKRRNSNESLVLDDDTLAATPRPFTSHMNKTTSSIVDSLWSSSKGETALSEVLIPYTPLRQERFYDWPPEPTQSRCTPLPNAKGPVFCKPNLGDQRPSLPDGNSASRLRSTPVSSSPKVPKKKFQLKSKQS